MSQPSRVVAGERSRIGCPALFLVVVDELRQMSARRRRRVGGCLLVDLARCLQPGGDDDTLLAPRGAEEFLALRRVPDAAAADRMGAEIGQRLAGRRFQCAGQEVRLTVHVGGAVAIGSAIPPGDVLPVLLEVAERALHEAKASRSQVRIARFLANQHGTWVGARVLPSEWRDRGTRRRVADGEKADTPPRPYGLLLRRSWLDG